MKEREVTLKSLIFKNFWFKLLALAVAIIVWLYVNGSISRGVFST